MGETVSNGRRTGRGGAGWGGGVGKMLTPTQVSELRLKCARAGTLWLWLLLRRGTGRLGAGGAWAGACGVRSGCASCAAGGGARIWGEKNRTPAAVHLPPRVNYAAFLVCARPSSGPIIAPRQQRPCPRRLSARRVLCSQHRWPLLRTCHPAHWAPIQTRADSATTALFDVRLTARGVGLTNSPGKRCPEDFRRLYAQSVVCHLHGNSWSSPHPSLYSLDIAAFAASGMAISLRAYRRS